MPIQIEARDGARDDPAENRRRPQAAGGSDLRPPPFRPVQLARFGGGARGTYTRSGLDWSKKFPGAVEAVKLKALLALMGL